MREKITKLTHAIEEVIGKHYELVVAASAAIPIISSLSGMFAKLGGVALPVLANIVNALKFDMVGALSAVEGMLLTGGVGALIAAIGYGGYKLGESLDNHAQTDDTSADALANLNKNLGRTGQRHISNDLFDYVSNLPAKSSTPQPGGGGDGLDDKELRKDYSALGLKDLAGELAAATAAFNELTAAGKLNAGQITEAKEKIANLRAELEMLRAGITPEQTKASVFGSMQGPAVQMSTLVENANTLKGSYQDIVKLLQSWSAATEKVALPTSLGPEVTDLVAEYERLQSDVKITGEAFQAFGLQTQTSLDKAVADATQNYTILRDSGEASYKDLAVAALKLAQVQADSAVHSGAITQQAWKDTTDKIKQDLDELDGAVTKEQSQISKDMGRAANSMFSSIEGDLAKDIVQWKGWQKSLTQITQTLAEDLLKVMLKALFKPLEDQVSAAFQQLGGMLGGVLGGSKPGSGGILGTGTSGLAGAITANTAAHTTNTAATTANTVSTTPNTAAVVTNTAATLADTTATGVNAGAQIAALATNTASEVTSTVSFDTASAANTAAVMANTAAQIGGGAAEEGGGFLGGLLSIFGFSGGGDAPRSRTGASMVKIHEQEMVLPPNIANGFRSLFSGVFSLNPTQVAVPAGAGGVGGTPINFANCTFGSGVTQSGVNSMMQIAIRQAKLAGGFKGM
jgi:hypothetical protein